MNEDKRTVDSSRATWGDRVSQYSKAIVATITPLASLGAILGPLLPASQSVPISAGVGIATGFLAWITSNTEIWHDQADQAESLAEKVTGRDL